MTSAAGRLKSLRQLFMNQIFRHYRCQIKWALAVAENVNTEELGNLGLTDEEEDAIVAFMETLSDGYVLKNK